MIYNVSPSGRTNFFQEEEVKVLNLYLEEAGETFKQHEGIIGQHEGIIGQHEQNVAKLVRKERKFSFGLHVLFRRLL